MQISLTDSVAVLADSARIYLYRPSNEDLDLEYPYDPTKGALLIPGENLKPGRYILKLTWHSRGVSYEVDRPVSIQ